MKCDVAVLGGGPGGDKGAIRAGQLGAGGVCVGLEPGVGGPRPPVGCVPTKGRGEAGHWVRGAQGGVGKRGHVAEDPELGFGAANKWKSGVVAQMTGGVASLFKANGVDWLRGRGTFSGPNTLVVEGQEDVTFDRAIIA